MEIDNSSEQIENDVKHYLNKIVKLLLVVCAYCKLKMISELKEKRKKEREIIYCHNPSNQVLPRENKNLRQKARDSRLTRQQNS
jgi:hypothetical protein